MTKIETAKASITILMLKVFKKIKDKIIITSEVRIRDPIAPAYVLLGLILVNFGPLNNFPKMKPPKSEATHPNSNIKRIYFDKILVEK